MIDVSIISNNLKELYTDKMKVYREDEFESEIGDIRVEKRLIYENVECRADPWHLEDEPITDKMEEDKIILPILIFCSIYNKIEKGDWIEIDRMAGDVVIGRYSGKANEPQIYPSHQEILIKHKQDN